MPDTASRASLFSWAVGFATETGIRTTSCGFLTAVDGRWQGGRVHESVRLDEEPGFLNGEIHHFTYRNLSDYLRRLETYSTLAAADYHERGKASTPLRMLLNPIATFVKAYLMKRGFLDGTPGFIVAVMGAVSVFFKYAKLHELQGPSEERRKCPRLLHEVM